MKEYTNNEELNKFAELLLANGFQLIVSKTRSTVKPSYFHFAKDNKIGYVQYGSFGFFTFSTVHKPCRECGTGYRIGKESETLTIDLAYSALVFAPSWANSKDLQAIRKYASAYDYAERNNKQWAPIGHEYKVIEPTNKA